MIKKCYENHRQEKSCELRLPKQTELKQLHCIGNVILYSAFRFLMFPKEELMFFRKSSFEMPGRDALVLDARFLPEQIP